jgi:TonB family protein
MQLETRVKASAFVALFLSGSAFAQPGCDCTNIIGSCSATADAHESFIEVTSNSEQCSRVDYLVDGIPFVTLVVNGTGQQPWSSAATSPDVIIQGCQVCQPTAASSGATGIESGLFTAGEVVRLIGVDPVYPPAALASGTEGFVEVTFTVTPDGMVSAAEVTASEPAGVFDQSALTALYKWRFTSDIDGESHTMAERFEFSFADELFELQPARETSQRPALASERRRNNCIQEQSRFDFGAMIDISLINACEEPLIVFSCATGVGSLSQRWVCRDAEPAALQSSAIRTGSSSPVPASSVTEPLIGNLEITRAPNGEYWWLACRIEDSNCRSDGREWVRSLDRQMAEIDPQGRTRARLARSY